MPFSFSSEFVLVFQKGYLWTMLVVLKSRIILIYSALLALFSCVSAYIFFFTLCQKMDPTIIKDLSVEVTIQNGALLFEGVDKLCFRIVKSVRISLSLFFIIAPQTLCMCSAFVSCFIVTQCILNFRDNSPYFGERRCQYLKYLLTFLKLSVYIYICKSNTLS